MIKSAIHYSIYKKSAIIKAPATLTMLEYVKFERVRRLETNMAYRAGERDIA